MTPIDPASPRPLAFDTSADPASADGLADGLSALVDGQADGVDSACARWRDDAEARRTWHAYHLIGDVMRSEELATHPSRDAAFLANLRERLATEAVPLSPSAVPAATSAGWPLRGSRRMTWLLPAAAAAGLVVVAGVLVLTRPAAPGDGSAGESVRMAAQVPPAQGGASAVRASVPLAPGRASDEIARTPSLIRDARLDEYLRAHQTAGGLAVATPGGWLRRVDAVVAQPPAR